jgi:PhnB protein
MVTINPYLNFKGNTEEAFNFYKLVFGGEFVTVQRFKETSEVAKLPPSDHNNIMHIALPIGNENILMGTDVLESAGRTMTVGDNVHLSVSTDSDEETKKVFDELAAGGKITMPLDKMFWGAYFGMCTDKFGVHWMVSNDAKK